MVLRFSRVDQVMSDTIQNEKFVELNYKVIDEKTGDVLVTVDYPLGYVHGVNDVLSEQVTKYLDGKKVGDIIEVPVDTNCYMVRETNHWCLPTTSKMFLKSIERSV